jgi:hypothetical protein
MNYSAIREWKKEQRANSARASGEREKGIFHTRPKISLHSALRIMHGAKGVSRRLSNTSYIEEDGAHIHTQDGAHMKLHSPSVTQSRPRPGISRGGMCPSDPFLLILALRAPECEKSLE